MLTERQKRNFCAELLQTYGIQIDINNELLPVFFVAYQSAVITESNNKKSRDHILGIITDFERNTASQLSNMEVRQYRFQSPKEALWFAYGKFGLLASIVSILCFAGWLIYPYQERNNQLFSQISYLLEKSPVQQKQVNDSIAAQLITLYPAKDLINALAGKNYVYRKDCKCIEIPLFFERKNK